MHERGEEGMAIQDGDAGMTLQGKTSKIESICHELKK